MKETKHDYQGCLTGNYYDSKCTGEFNSWSDFKNTHLGFNNSKEGFDDRDHFVFRYDIHKQNDDNYILDLCMMLDRKGIYTHLYIYNISQKLLNTEIKEWLKYRKKYLSELWTEV